MGKGVPAAMAAGSRQKRQPRRQSLWDSAKDALSQILHTGIGMLPGLITGLLASGKAFTVQARAALPKLRAGSGGVLFDPYYALTKNPEQAVYDRCEEILKFGLCTTFQACNDKTGKPVIFAWREPMMYSTPTGVEVDRRGRITMSQRIIMEVENLITDEISISYTVPAAMLTQPDLLSNRIAQKSFRLPGKAKTQIGLSMPQDENYLIPYRWYTKLDQPSDFKRRYWRLWDAIICVPDVNTVSNTPYNEDTPVIRFSIKHDYISDHRANNSELPPDMDMHTDFFAIFQGNVQSDYVAIETVTPPTVGMRAVCPNVEGGVKFDLKQDFELLEDNSLEERYRLTFSGHDVTFPVGSDFRVVHVRSGVTFHHDGGAFYSREKADVSSDDVFFAVDSHTPHYSAVMTPPKFVSVVSGEHLPQRA